MSAKRESGVVGRGNKREAIESIKEGAGKEVVDGCPLEVSSNAL